MLGLAGGAGSKGACGQRDVVIGTVEGAHHTQVFVVAETLGEMLQERASQRNIDQLHASADTEHRHIPLDRGAKQRDFKESRSGTVSGLGVGLLAVAGGVDIGAASKHQAVEQVEHLARSRHERGSGASIRASAPARWTAST